MVFSLVFLFLKDHMNFTSLLSHLFSIKINYRTCPSNPLIFELNKVMLERKERHLMVSIVQQLIVNGVSKNFKL